MNRTTTRTTGDRMAMGMSRAVVDTVNNSPFMQTIGAKIMGSEASTDIEHFEPFGSSAVVMGKTTDEQAQGGMMKGAAEFVVGGLMGNRSHPIAFPATDRRFRINGLKGGENASYDAFKQFLHFGKDAMMGESPKKVVHRVAVEKQQSSGSGGSGASGSSSSAGQQQKKNNGADVTAEKDVKVSVEMDKDGLYTVNATGAGTIKCKTLTLDAGGCKITMKDGKITLTGEVHLGGDGGQLLHRKGDADSRGDTAVGSSTKVYAI